MKGQGSLEYLLLIGGAVFVAALVITTIYVIGSGASGGAKEGSLDALCLELSEEKCGASDPDATGPYASANCVWDSAQGKCIGNPSGCGASCVSGDGCCPSGCTNLTDSDCSAAPACTEPSTQECTIGGCAGTQTCTGEIWGSCIKNDLCCGVTCNDSNPCTTDACSGGSCTFLPKTSCVNSDGCCPSGCSSLNDNDCTPSGCTDGDTQACTIGSCPGTQTCSGGSWSSCIKSDPCCEVNCDDGDACTTDSCSGGACSHQPISGCGAPEAAAPRGVYAMITATIPDGEINEILSKPFVDGALIMGWWDKIETSEGVYDWSSIDRYLDMIKAKGKKASIAIIASKATPDWVYAKGVEKWEFVDAHDQPVTLPNPMDEDFYGIWFGFVNEFGERYGSDSSITQVSMCGGTSALCGLRFYVLPPDWNSDFVVSEWKKTVDTYASAFPNTYLVNEVQSTSGEGTTLADEMLSYDYSNYGNKIGPFEEFLSATAPTGALADIMVKWGPKSGKSWCGFQQVHALGTDLDAGYAHGFNDIGCQYFEIYKTDLLNPDYDAVNQKWHDIIWSS